MKCKKCGKEFKPKLKTKWYQDSIRLGHVDCPNCNYQYDLKKVKPLKMFSYSFVIFIFILIFLIMPLIDQYNFTKLPNWAIEITALLILYIILIPIYNWMIMKVFSKYNK